MFCWGTTAASFPSDIYDTQKYILIQGVRGDKSGIAFSFIKFCRQERAKDPFERDRDRDRDEFPPGNVALGTTDEPVWQCLGGSEHLDSCLF